VNDDFEATEYNMTVAHSSVFRLEDFSLDSYYNQENLKNGWFEIGEAFLACQDTGKRVQ
jgi:hypothetical protein